MKKAMIEQQVLGMVSTNVWFLKNNETGELLIIDPAAQADRIEQKVQMMGGKPVAVLLTHGHFDHIMAVEEVRKRWEIPVYALEKEKEVLESPQKNLSGSWINRPCTVKADYWLRDGQEIDLAGFAIQVLHTPGHTEGSCCYYLEDEGVLFSGDTLFCGSVGRTDMPTSSSRQMQQSIARIMKEIPDETKVYPGHNEETTIAYEKRYNPFA